MSTESPDPVAPRLAPTGIRGLDGILGGGLPRDRIYLVDGVPGTGKTTLAMQFLLQGRDSGEPTMYVTLSETGEELAATAASHGWNLENVKLFELGSYGFTPDDDAYTLFQPSEVELQETVQNVFRAVEEYKPARVVFDSLSEMRMLARDSLRFRRQILALKQFFAGRDCTALLLDDRTALENDLQLQSIAHGVISLEHLAMDYGAERRRLQILKLRGARYRGGYHDFRITTGGIEVYPRILQRPPISRENEVDSSGSKELDALLGGGITRGTSALITGSAGTGKSVLGVQYALAATKEGRKTRLYMFDERITTAFLRSDSIKMDLGGAIDSGLLSLRQIEPTEMSPGEFANDVMRAVEEDGVSLIVLDSLNGLLQAMPAERLLAIQVHELLSYLAGRGVTIIMTLVQTGIFGSPVDEAAEVSYLADTVILLRYFEHAGAVRQAVSVVKKRSGLHERTIRECQVGEGGLRIGEPLSEFRGVLTGVPVYTGGSGPLMERGAPAPDDYQPA
jgi:circadian clock protein KaiC